MKKQSTKSDLIILEYAIEIHTKKLIYAQL